MGLIRKIKRVLMWIAIAIAALHAFKVYEFNQLQQAHFRAMELLGKP